MIKSNFKVWLESARISQPEIHPNLVETDFWLDNDRIDGIIAWADTDKFWTDNSDYLVLLFEEHLQCNLQVFHCFGDKLAPVAGNQRCFGRTLSLAYNGTHYAPIRLVDLTP